MTFARRHWREALVLALFAAIAVSLCLPVWLHPGHAWIGQPGDPQATMWYMAWIPRGVLRHVNPFRTDFIDFPRGTNVMWSNADAVAALALVFAPLTRVAGLIVTYNVILTLSMTLSAWLAYVFLLRWVTSHVAAAAGAVVFGFGTYVTSQALGHLGLTVMVAPPLLLLLFDELLVRRRVSPRWIGFWIAVVAALQVLTAEEVLATEAIVGVVALLVLAAFNVHLVRQSVRPLVESMLVALPWFVTFTALPLGTQFLGEQRIHGIIRGPDVYVSDLQSFVVPHLLNMFATARTIELTASWSGNPSEWDAYLGLPLVLALGLLALLRTRVPAMGFAVVMTALVAVMSLGPILHVGGNETVWRHGLLWRVPEHGLLANILPARLMAYGDLFAGMALAIGLDPWLSSSGLARRAGAGLMALACVVPLAPHLPLIYTEAVIPAFFADGGHAKLIPLGSVALLAPYDTGGEVSWAMQWQAISGIRFHMPEGYALQPDASGNGADGPPTTPLSAAMIGIRHGQAAPPLKGDVSQRQAMIVDLRRWQVGTVVVGPMEHEHELAAFFTELVGRPPVADGDCLVWWNVDLFPLPGEATPPAGAV